MDRAPEARVVGICLDCRDAPALSDFYAGLLRWEVVGADRDEWRQLRPPNGGLHLNIQAEEWYEPPAWPEHPGRPAKMMHLEIEVDDVADAVARAVALGATEPRDQPSDRDPARLRVLLDPAGHPFCVFIAGE